uniref:Homeobox protein Hox-B13 isoform X1 n=1 Tax=Pogona vitticeps TaxID=103695 RepID=A0ABM5GS22_9SAUR
MDPEGAFGEARRRLEAAAAAATGGDAKGMAGLLSSAPFPAGGPCRSGALGGPSPSSPSATMPGPGYPPLDGPGETSGKPCIPCPAVPQPSSTSSASPFSYGCFGGGYYSYRVARSSLKPCPAPPQAAYPAEKYLDAACTSSAPAAAPAAAAAPPEEYPTRPAEFAFYPGYAGPYQPMASYLDVSVVQTLGGPPGDARHEALLPVDPYHEPWALAGGWNNQMCCPKEPSPAGHFWKTAFAGNACRSKATRRLFARFPRSLAGPLPPLRRPGPARPSLPPRHRSAKTSGLEVGGFHSAETFRAPRPKIKRPLGPPVFLEGTVFKSRRVGRAVYESEMIVVSRGADSESVSAAASLGSCRPTPARGLHLPPGPQEEDPLQQRAAERAGERVLQQQVHHQGQEEEDLRRHQPHRETDHHLVPEPEGEREESRGQSEDRRRCQQHEWRRRRRRRRQPVRWRHERGERGGRKKQKDREEGKKERIKKNGWMEGKKEGREPGRRRERNSCRILRCLPTVLPAQAMRKWGGGRRTKSEKHARGGFSDLPTGPRPVLSQPSPVSISAETPEFYLLALTDVGPGSFVFIFIFFPKIIVTVFVF